jgi:multimeric flavodoxin WrbA
MADGVLRSFANSQLAVLLSPITFGGYSSEIKKVLDRSIGLVSPYLTRVGSEVHHRPRYACAPALLAVGVIRDHDAQEAEIFARLVARNAINLHAPASFAVIVSREDRPEQIREAIRCGLTQVTARRGVA